MGKAWVIAVGGCVVVAGCGTVLEIQPDVALGNDGGAASDGASGGEGGATVDTGTPGDAASEPPTPPCAQNMAAVPCQLASGLVNLGGIAVGNGNVYFTRHENPGGIYQVPTTGGAVAPFAIGSSFPAGLSATVDSVLWVTEGDFQIVRQGFTASTPSSSTYDVASPAAHIVSVGSTTYWTIPGSAVITDGQVRKTEIFNAGNAIANNAAQPTALAADINYVYFATKTTLGHVARIRHIDSAMATTGDMFPDVSALALSAIGIVAITAIDGVHRASTLSDPTFMGPWETISSNGKGVGLVVDDLTGTVYVLAANGTLESIPNVPTPPVKTINMASCPAGTAIAQDASHVYLACKDTIVRVPK